MDSEKFQLKNPLHSNIIGVGPVLYRKNVVISGQAMMFQLTIDKLRESGWNIKVFDINEISENATMRSSGQFSFERMIDYVKLIPLIWLHSCIGEKKVIYLTSAQSRIGFLRDMAVIWPLKLFNHCIICHQFGGNYKTFYSTQSAAFKFLIRKTLEASKAVIVEGESVKKQFSFLKNYEETVYCIPNGLPESDIEYPTTPKSYYSSEGFRLFYLSNMIETKGYWDVLEAVYILVKQKRKKVFCIFAGNFLESSDSKKFSDADQARRSFFNYIKDNDLENHVQYKENLIGDAKKTAFKSSHVFLLPSNYINEGQPVSILEAMAYGAVTIATNYRLIPTMVEDGVTGFFVRYARPDEIANRIQFLMDHPNLFKKMSQQSIERFHKNFSADVYANKIENFFISVID